MQTIDGRAGSAKRLIKMMDDREISLYKNSKTFIESKMLLGEDEIPKTLLIKIRLKNRLLVLRQAYLKYLIIKFRQKISFIAFKNKMTIVELFCTAIQKSYN
jgi:hypothetical protein